MASSYTTNLRLELQVTGENRSSWGSKANNVFTMVEEAITGWENVAMANADTVLTAVNGTTDQARNMFLKLTGANTAVRKLVIPPVSKMYIVWNTTGQPVDITTNATVTLPLLATFRVANGAWKMIFTDGAAIWSNNDFVTVSASGKRWGIIPNVDPTTGYMEIGSSIDFHNTDADTSDFSVSLHTNNTITDLYVTPQGLASRKIWNSGNDGSGSGMDADTLDGKHAADITFPDAPVNGKTYARKDGAWVEVAPFFIEAGTGHVILKFGAAAVVVRIRTDGYIRTASDVQIYSTTVAAGP